MLRHQKMMRDRVLQLALDLVNNLDVDRGLIGRSAIVQDALAVREGICRVAVIAPFSAGKSTFINALLGTELLSSSMLAETAMITRIRYGVEARLTVVYNEDHGQDFLPATGSGLSQSALREMVRLVTTVARTPEQEDQLRQHLPRYATAPGTVVEEKVREVVVEAPFKLCEEGVELIDTPGLFASYPGHNEITGRIMPEADAIIFMLEPDKLGEAHFGQWIRTYVEEAKQSNLDGIGRHIFFLINKLDLYPEHYELAVQEVKRMLTGVLKNPQILGVSSHYALAARRFLNGEIELRDLQKDKYLSIPDPADPDFPLSGRALTEEHLPLIESVSRIREVEETLGWYLINRNQWLIENLIRTVNEVYRKAAEGAGDSIEAARHALADRQVDYKERIRIAQRRIEELEVNLSVQIDRLIYEVLTNKNNGLTQKVEICFEHCLRVTKGKLARTMLAEWEQNRDHATRENAWGYLMQANELGEKHAQILLKEATREAFVVVNQATRRLTLFLRHEFARHKVDLESILAELGLGHITNGAEGINLDNLAYIIQAQIEELFRAQVKVAADTIQEQVRQAESQHTQERLQGGLWNWARSQVGFGRIEEVFNLSGFLDELDGVLAELIQMHSAHVGNALDSVVTAMLSRISDIANRVKQQADQVIDFELRGHRADLEKVMQELSLDTLELKGLIKEKQETSRRLLAASDRVRRFQEELEAGVA